MGRERIIALPGKAMGRSRPASTSGSRRRHAPVERLDRDLLIPDAGAVRASLWKRNPLPERIRGTCRRLESAEPGAEVNEYGVRPRRPRQERIGGPWKWPTMTSGPSTPLIASSAGRDAILESGRGILQRQVGHDDLMTAFHQQRGVSSSQHEGSCQAPWTRQKVATRGLRGTYVPVARMAPITPIRATMIEPPIRKRRPLIA